MPLTTLQVKKLNIIDYQFGSKSLAEMIPRYHASVEMRTDLLALLAGQLGAQRDESDPRRGGGQYYSY